MLTFFLSWALCASLTCTKIDWTLPLSVRLRLIAIQSSSNPLWSSSLTSNDKNILWNHGEAAFYHQCGHSSYNSEEVHKIAPGLCKNVCGLDHAVLVFWHLVKCHTIHSTWQSAVFLQLHLGWHLHLHMLHSQSLNCHLALQTIIFLPAITLGKI